MWKRKTFYECAEELNALSKTFRYDFKSLRVRKLSSERKSFGGTIVRLEPDVAEMFPSADAVNEALRFLIGVMRDDWAIAPTAQANN